jgi:hypothetical protein
MTPPACPAASSRSPWTSSPAPPPRAGVCRLGACCLPGRPGGRAVAAGTAGRRRPAAAARHRPPAGLVPRRASRSLPLLRARLAAEPDPDAKATMAVALGLLAGWRGETGDAARLEALLGDADAVVRWAAAVALARLFPQALPAPAVEELLGWLTGANTAGRRPEVLFTEPEQYAMLVARVVPALRGAGGGGDPQAAGDHAELGGPAAGAEPAATRPPRSARRSGRVPATGQAGAGFAGLAPWPLGLGLPAPHQPTPPATSQPQETAKLEDSRNPGLRAILVAARQGTGKPRRWAPSAR